MDSNRKRLKVVVTSMDRLLVEGLTSQFVSENLRRVFDIATVEVDSYAQISAEEMNGLIEENDVFVMDLNGVNSAFVENLAVQLKLSRFGGRKKVILLSNVLTWEKTLLEAIETEPEEEEEKDEEEPEGQKEVKKEDAGQVWGEPDDGEDETWEGGLECSEEEEGAEALAPSVPLKESDYPRRGASSDYQGMIELENLFLSLREQLDWLGVHVVCPGVLYGREGVPLEELFELAWSQKSPLPVLGNGKNEVPCVHFRDLVTLIRFLAVEDALRLRKYVFAVDRNRKRCQGSLVRAVAKRFGPGKVKKVDEREADVYSAELRRVLRLNLPLKFDPAVDVWLARRKKALEAAEAEAAAKAAEEAAEKEESPKEGDENRVDLNAEPEAAGPVKLPPPAGVEWTCMAGLPAESESLRLEFVERRSLRPLKILVAGPPFSGKTSLARRLAAHYRVPYIHAREVVASVAAENSPSGERLRAFLEARIESSRAAAEAAATSRRAKGRPPQPMIPITKEEIFDTLPETAVATLIGRRLCENDTRNNGYVLDGFPEHEGQARLLFLHSPPQPIDPEDPSDPVDPASEDLELPDPEDPQNPSPPVFLTPTEERKVLNPAVAPSICLFLRSDEGDRMARVAAQGPEERVSLDSLRLKTETWAKNNESPLVDSLKSTLESFGLPVLEPPLPSLADSFKAAVVFIERNGKFQNFNNKNSEPVAKELESQRRKLIDEAQVDETKCELLAKRHRFLNRVFEAEMKQKTK